MTFKNTKTILFASLIVAMILPFSGMQFAEAENQLGTQKVKITKNALELTTSYVTIDENGISSFDAKQAKKDGLKKKIVQSVKVFYKEQNKMVRGETVDLEQFKDLVVELQESSDINTAWWCNPYGQIVRPSPVFEDISTNSVEQVKAFLNNNGYHNVAEYALHPDATPEQQSRDFQKNTEAHGCSENSGIYRQEAYVVDSNTYRTTEPEPNPEILSYIWPSYWWPTYVGVWHGLF